MSNEYSTATELENHIEKQTTRAEHLFRHTLHILEQVVAGIIIVALVIALGEEVWKVFIQRAYVGELNAFLHHVLTIVVGLEFVRMIIDTTPASILEVLTVAITRHVILSHDDPWSNLACIACIAGLFAIRRFLIRHEELKEELVEDE